MASEPLQNEPSVIPVVAAVIREGVRFFLCQRPGHKRHGGLWEFPGGKVGKGENLDDAVRRELSEELGVRTKSVGTEIGRFQDGGSKYVIHFLQVAVEGIPIAREHQALGWFSLEEMVELALAPADRAFVENLRRGDAQ